jgi:hypothetical protein
LGKNQVEKGSTVTEWTPYYVLNDEKLQVADDSITTKKLADGSVTADKIADGVLDGIKSDLTDIETLIKIYHGSAPTSWAEVQAIVRSGLASKVFSIGDQLTCNKGDEVLTWDIIGIDCDTPSDENYTHSMTLQLHDCYASLQFDRNEAFYYCETELPAGTYNVTCGVNLGTNCVAGKTYQFTLTKSVPAGGQLVGFERMPDTTTDSWTVHTYASNSLTAEIESATVTEGSGGTSLGTFQIAVQGNLNSLHRLAYGSNNYLESAIRQVINSDKAAGSVWTPETKFDRPPTWATSEAGFLSGVDADFLSVLGKVKKVTARNTVTDGGGSDTSDELIFLLSRSEIYAGLENNINEGSAYPYYANYSDYSAANMGNDTNRIKYRNGVAQYWCLRSPTAINDASHMRYVSTSGALSSGNAYNSYGVAPACCIV